MALLDSHAFDRNFPCPAFGLYSVDDQFFQRSDFDESKALLVAFICNHCPYVKAIEDRLVALRKKYNTSDLAMVGICSNDPSSYPDDSKAMLLKRWQEKNYGFPYLLDVDQQVAHAFDAVCTPDLFLFDKKRKLFYRGRLDNNWRDQSQVSKHDLTDALELLLKDQEPPTEQIPSQGCSIKWFQ